MLSEEVSAYEMQPEVGRAGCQLPGAETIWQYNSGGTYRVGGAGVVCAGRRGQH